jgi:hypothetical protein
VGVYRLALSPLLVAYIAYCGITNRIDQAKRGRAATRASQELRLADLESQRESLRAQLSNSDTKDNDRILDRITRSDKQIVLLKYEIGRSGDLSLLRAKQTFRGRTADRRCRALQVSSCN